MKRKASSMIRRWIVIVHPSNSSSDWTEKAQAFLAQQTLRCLGTVRVKQRVVEIDELRHRQIVDALGPKHNISLIVLHGHGKATNGSLKDAAGHIAIGPKDGRLMTGRSVFAFYCYSSKLFLKIRELSPHRLPARWVGLRDQLWLAGIRTGQTYRGFHESAWAGARTLLTKQNAQLAAMRLEREASKWLTEWLCTLVISSLDRNFSRLRTSLLCCLGLLTITSNIFFYDEDY